MCYVDLSNLCVVTKNLFFILSKLFNFAWFGLEQNINLCNPNWIGYFCMVYQESIAGKCNLVCISKDARNPQPSEEAVRNADFVFYRCFDVGKRKVVEEIDDKILGLEGMQDWY